MAILSEPLFESTIKILFFSGKPEDFFIWKSKRVAKAARFSYRDLMLGETTIPSNSEKKAAKLVEEDARSPDQKATLKNWRLACRGYEDLILAMNTS